MDASEAEAKSLVAGADQFGEEQVVTRNLRRGKCALFCMKLKWFLYGIMISVGIIFVAENFYHVGMSDYVTHWVGSLDLSLSIHNGTVDFHPFANSSTNGSGGKRSAPAPSKIVSEGTKPPSSIRRPTAAPTTTLVVEDTEPPEIDPMEKATEPPAIDTEEEEKEDDPVETDQPQPDKDTPKEEPKAKGTWFENEDERPEESTDSPTDAEDGEADTHTEESDGEQTPESEPVPEPNAKNNSGTSTWFEPNEPDFSDLDLDDVKEVKDTVQEVGESPEMRRPDGNGGFLDDDLPYAIIDDFFNDTVSYITPNHDDTHDDLDKEKAGDDVNADIEQSNANGGNNGKTQLNTTAPYDTNGTSQLNATAANQLNTTDEAWNTTNSSVEVVEYRPLPVKYQYQRRHETLYHLDTKHLANHQGDWKFLDLSKERPANDYCADYPNRDIPWDKLPENAWQRDEEFTKPFLAEGKALVMRAMEAILHEYGFGPTAETSDFFARRDKSPFALTFSNPNDPAERRKLSPAERLHQAGKTTQKSYMGLVRRLLHAVVTRDTFNLVMGGHSAAAGHGNNFQQSYTLQFQRVMEPVFARLGVKHFARNIGMGGLGTIQNAMGAQDIYGRDVDILIWDSGMTESSESPDFDLFARQGILGSDRAPMLWSANDDAHVYVALQEHADIDYMIYGTGRGEGVIPQLKDPTHIYDIPWAARYLECDPEFQGLCDENKYNGTCWVERPDHFQPPTPQQKEPGGRASWHSGNREHQLYGRVLAFTVLRALWDALDRWDKQPRHVLSDAMWHMTDYYNNIKSKIATLDRSVGTCNGIADKLPDAFCRIPFQARTEFTPRAYPEETSLRSIMKPFGPDMQLPQPRANIYDPPDVRLEVVEVPYGNSDYLAVVENGLPYWEFDAPAPPLPVARTGNQLIKVTVDAEGEEIVPGLGWGVTTLSSPESCNGTYDSFCGRGADNPCLLYGHNDFRGGLTFDSLSGWGVFTLRNLKHGMIFVKMDSWRKPEENPVTEEWTEVNKDGGGRSLSVSSHEHKGNDGLGMGHRGNLRKMTEGFCPDLVLEFAVGEKVIQIKSDDILGEKHSLVQRVVQIWTVLNDPDFTKGETLDVELGIRLRGCERQNVFWLTHIYWA